jgi:hypothetical protein
MVIEEAGAGLVVKCPECGGDATVPSAKPPTDSSMNKERTVALKWTPPPDNPPPPTKK